MSCVAIRVHPGPFLHALRSSGSHPVPELLESCRRRRRNGERASLEGTGRQERQKCGDCDNKKKFTKHEISLLSGGPPPHHHGPSGTAGGRVTFFPLIFASGEEEKARKAEEGALDVDLKRRKGRPQGRPTGRFSRRDGLEPGRARVHRAAAGADRQAEKPGSPASHLPLPSLVTRFF